MIKRILVIVGIVIVFGATAVVAVAIWPERTGESGSTSTSVEPAPGGADAGRTSTGRALPVQPSIGTYVSPDAKRFALQAVTGPLPVHYAFKHPPLAGVLFDVKTGRI